MLFPHPPAHVDDIRAFCHRFDEGIRVEYKSNFDDNVRSKIAKILSSFANTLGGVTIIGVPTDNGIPQPIEGFEIPNQELPLQIQQICLQGINPPVIPRIVQIASDVPGRCFLVVEVDESPEAPHAIENETRVYVRTGNASNPYELAKVDLIIERFTRRRELQARRSTLVRHQALRASELMGVQPAEMAIEVIVGPPFPLRTLVDRDFVWNFGMEQTYRSGRFIPQEVVRRTKRRHCWCVGTQPRIWRYHPIWIGFLEKGCRNAANNPWRSEFLDLDIRWCFPPDLEGAGLCSAPVHCFALSRKHSDRRERG